jgi:DNA-binding transcriptional regulator YbjK
MEAVMTQEANALPPIQQWWEEAGITGKQYCTLKENGELVLNAAPPYPERVIATLTEDNAAAVIRALQEKFPEVEGKLKELQAEWTATDDKLKLIGKLARTREYLLHTNAIGDFAALHSSLDEMDKVIAQLTEENYKTKLALVEQAEALAGSDSWKETTQALRDLGDKWKQTGFLDKQKNDELWNRLEEARNKFFDRKRQHQEAQEKDMLQNLDLKMELVEKAESLAASEDWKETTDIFRKLMDQWKTIGRTLPDKNEELWNRFIMAKNVFYDRKKLHFESIQQEQEANYAVKLALVEKAESFRESTDWTGTSQVYADIMEEWKNTGRVPAEKADELWSRLTAAKEQFFQAKRHHFEAMRVSLDDNYAQKLALLKRAESLKNSTHWRETTEELNELMTEWKKIGPVPREHSDKIWEAFIAARTHFFNRKDEDRERRKSQAEKQLNSRTQQTRQFLARLKEELKEEEDKLEDFRNGLDNITSGHKEEELRRHLEKLIAQGEHKVKHKQEKIEEVTKQLSELETKTAPVAKNEPSAEDADK